MKFFKYKSTAIAYKNVFSSVQGKEVLDDLIKSCYLLSPTFSKDPYETAFKEGQRNVVLKILQLLEVDLNKVEEMIKQSHDEHEI